MATVLEFPGFNAEADAQILESAMKGLGTSEEPIIDVLAKRTTSQRHQIALMFKASFGKDLEKSFSSELSGHFKEVVLTSLRDKAHINAKALYDAIAGAGTTEHVIYQIICPLDNAEIHALREAYNDVLIEKGENPLRRDIEKDIKGDLKGDFEKLMIALLQGTREKGIDKSVAKVDVEDLLNAGEKKLGTDEAVFTRIFARRSFDHIKLIDLLYAEKQEHGLLKAIKKEISGDYEKALSLIVKTAFHKGEAIADMIRDTMKGGGTYDSDLIRLVLAYSEDNMVEVKKIFEEKNGKSLANWIKEDTSGDYQKFLVAIVGDD